MSVLCFNSEYVPASEFDISRILWLTCNLAEYVCRAIAEKMHKCLGDTLFATPCG